MSALVDTPDRTEPGDLRESPALPAKADPQPAPPTQPRATYGTTVEFARTPAAAAQLARHEHKLLFELQLSGNFEDPGCT